MIYDVTCLQKSHKGQTIKSDMLKYQEKYFFIKAQTSDLKFYSSEN